MMRFTQSEKMEIIRLLEGSTLPVAQTLRELDVPRSSFYRWYRRYNEEGYDGLANRPPNARRFWNKIPGSEKQRVIDVALAEPELTPRELAWHITEQRRPPMTPANRNIPAPTEPGLWWVRENGGDSCWVRVYRDGNKFCGEFFGTSITLDLPEELDGLWTGPYRPPEDSHIKELRRRGGDEGRGEGE